MIGTTLSFHLGHVKLHLQAFPVVFEAPIYKGSEMWFIGMCSRPTSNLTVFGIFCKGKGPWIQEEPFHSRHRNTRHNSFYIDVLAHTFHVEDGDHSLKSESSESSYCTLPSFFFKKQEKHNNILPLSWRTSFKVFAPSSVPYVCHSHFPMFSAVVIYQGFGVLEDMKMKFVEENQPLYVVFQNDKHY